MVRVRVCARLQERTKDAQFVIISLRNNMFELADRLVGVYKTRDVTKSVTINPKALAAESLTASVAPTAAAGAGKVVAVPAAAATTAGVGGEDGV